MGSKREHWLILRILVCLAAARLADGQAPEPQTRAGSPIADEIMARVAVNQRRTEEVRNEYHYTQHIHIATHKPQTRMMREENADYEVIPQPDGIQKHLKSLTGRYWNKDKYVDFQGEPPPGPSKTDRDLIHNLSGFEPAPITASTDLDLIRYLRSYLLEDNSKDGLARALFPLTFEQQKKYDFQLLGEEVESGRKIYHIAFAPKDKQELTWTGEAFIDAEEFQPVRVFTKMSRKPPFLVRTMWFDLPGLGFNVAYQRQEDGVWFPTIFGTEFRMHTGAVFYFNRDVSISVENSGFEHTHAEAK